MRAESASFRKGFCLVVYIYRDIIINDALRVAGMGEAYQQISSI
jgi:hypothetical protein